MVVPRCYPGVEVFCSLVRSFNAPEAGEFVEYRVTSFVRPYNMPKEVCLTGPGLPEAHSTQPSPGDSASCTDLRRQEGLPLESCAAAALGAHNNFTIKLDTTMHQAG